MQAPSRTASVLAAGEPSHGPRCRRRPMLGRRRACPAAHNVADRCRMASGAARARHGAGNCGRRLLLLDEPMAGLGTAGCAGDVALLARAEEPIHDPVLVEHDMDAVFALADRITVLVEGRRRDGRAGRNPQQRQVRIAYLGEDTRNSPEPTMPKVQACRRATAGARCCSTSSVEVGRGRDRDAARP